MSYLSDYKQKKVEQKTTTNNGGFLRTYKANKDIGMDTLDADLESLSTSVNDAVSKWQSAETMANTKASMEKMLGRLDIYNSTYGGSLDDERAKALNSTIGTYKDLYDNWDSLSASYAQAKDADSYSAWLENQKKKYAEQNKEAFDDYAYLMENEDYAKRSGRPIADNSNKVGIIEKMRDEGKRKVATSFNAPNAKYGYLTDDERNTYYYLVNTNPQMAEKFLEDIDANLNKRRTAKDLEFYQDYADKHPFLSSVTSVANNFFGGAVGAVGDIANEVAGGNYDGNAWWHTLSNRAEGIQSEVASNMPTLPGWLYSSVAMSAANSLVNMLTLGNSASLVNMGMQAFTSTGKQLHEAGASDERVLVGALLSGIIEGATEKIGVDEWFKPKSIKRVKDIAITLAKQAGAEGLEEIISEICNQLVDRTAGELGSYSEIMDKVNEYKLLGYTPLQAEGKVLGENVIDIILAGVGGALSGLMLGGVDAVRQYDYSTNLGNDIAKYGNLDTMREVATNLGETELAENLKEGATPTMLGGTYLDLESKAIKSKDIDSLKKLNYGSSENRTVDIATGKSIKVNGLSLDGDNVVVNTSEGKRAINEILVAGMSEPMDIDSIDDKQLFVDNYKGGNLGSYYFAFNEAYNLAKLGLPESEVNSFIQKSIANKALSAETLSAIFRSGVKKSISHDVAMLNDAVAKFKEIAPNRDFNYTQDFSFNGKDKSKIEWSKLTDNQKGAIVSVIGISKSANANVRWFDSKNTTEEQLKSSDGFYDSRDNTIWIDVNSQQPILVTFSHEVTHWMKNKSPELYRSLQDAIISTLIFEKNTTFDELVISEMNKLANLHKYTKAEAIANQDSLREEALDEIVARACEDMLSNSEYAQKLLSSMTPETRKGFVAKVREFLEKVIADLKAFFNKFESTRSEAMILRQDIDNFEKIKAKWDKLFEEATKTTQAIDAYVKENGGAKKNFALKSNVEQVNNLIAIHNMHEKELVETLKLGGFPMPSIALMLASNAMENKNYGEWSVIFNKNSIDPALSARNKIYSGDAWTPTFPKIYTELNETVAGKIYRKMIDIADSSYAGMINSVDFHPDNLSDALTSAGSAEALVEKYKNNNGMKQAFLNEKGNAVKNYPTTIERTEISDRDRNIFEALLKIMPEEIKNLEESPSRAEILRDYFSENEDTIRKALADAIGAGSDKLVKPMILIKISRAIGYQKDGGVKETEKVDSEKFNEMITERVDQKEYEEWLAKLFKGIEGRKGIKNSKDWYTPSGNRRSWSALFDEVTLDNIVANMMDDKAKGNGFLGLGSPLASATYEFKNIQEIKDKSYLLKHMDEEEYKAIRQNLLDKYEKIVGEFNKSDEFGAYLDASKDLSDIISKSRTFEQLSRNFKEQAKWYNVNDSIINDTWQFMQDVWELPTGYFEAKPQKAMYFDRDVAYMVGPSDASDDVKQKLADLGVIVEYYDTGNDVSRIEAINSHPEVLFAKKTANMGLAKSEYEELISFNVNVSEEKKESIKSHDGRDYIVQINNKLVYNDGDTITPDISMVVEFVADDFHDTLASAIRKDWYEYERKVGKHTKVNYASLSQSECIACYKEFGRESYITLYNRTNTNTYGRNGFFKKGKIRNPFNRNIADLEERERGYSEIRRSSKDSDGNKLTEEQISYFSESVVRDSNGNLLVMYHGTPNATFTKFRPGTYFTQNKEYADVYQNTGASSISVKTKAENPDTYKVYLNITKPFDTRLPNVKKIWDEKFFRKYGNGTPLSESGLPDWTDGLDIVEFIEDNELDFDGIILDEGATGGYGDEVQSRGLSYVIMSPEQVKNVDNTNPTASDDIRYSPKDIEVTTSEEADRVINELYNENAELKRLLEIEKSITDEVIIDEAKLDSFVNEVYDFYRADKSEKEGFKRVLKNLYTALKSDKDYNLDDFKKQARSLANIVIDSSPKNEIDAYSKQMQDKLKAYFKGVKLQLNDNQKRDLESASGMNWHKALFGRINTANEGQELDVFFNEMLDNIPELREFELSTGTTLSEVVDADEAVALWELVNHFYNEQYIEWNSAMVNGAITDLTNRIIDGVWDITPTESLAQKYDAKINNLNAEYKKKLAELKKKIGAFNEKAYKEKYQKQLEETEKKYRNELNAMQASKDRMLEEIQKLKTSKSAKVSTEEKQQIREEYRSRFKEMYDRKILREKIEKKVKRLSLLLEKNDSEMHCSEAIKKYLGRVLLTLDFTSGREQITNNDVDFIVEYRKLKEAVQNALEQNENFDSEYFDFSEEYIAEMQETIKNLEELTEEYKDDVNIIRLLDSEKLRGINKVLNALTNSIYQSEKSLTAQRRKSALAKGRDSREYLKQFGDAKTRGSFANTINNHLHWKNILPAYVFERFGAGGESIFDELVEANDNYAFLVKQISDDVNGMYTDEEASTWYREVKDITVNGKSYKMTVAQIMNLYELSKREGARQHLLKNYVKNDGEIGAKEINGQGMVISGIDKVSNATTKIELTEADIKSITDLLTDRQKSVADKMQKYLATTCAMWGNYVSMHRFGMLQFTEANYMPMQVFNEKNTEAKETMETAKMFALLNRGFTKSLNDSANGALVINDIFSVFAKHAQEMAMLRTFGLPVLDAFAWMSYKDTKKDETGFAKTSSLKEEAQRVYGTVAIDTIKQYLENLNGAGYRSPDAEKIAKTLLKHYKASAVAGNLRVAIMQPVAIVRATRYIDAKYIARAYKTKLSEMKEVAKRQSEYSGISMWKNELGQFSNAVSREITQDIVKTNSKLSKSYEKLMDVMMKPAELGDRYTWQYLYRACELEVAEKTGLEGEALNEAVAKKFSYIVHRTQVVNTVNTRSENMKSEQLWMQLLTAFMSEPTVSYSMLESEYFNMELEARKVGWNKAFKAHAKEISKSFMAVALTALCTSIVASFPDHLRDKPENQSVQEYMKKIMENFLQEMTSLEPFAKEASNIILSGYSPSRSELAVIDTTWKGVEKLTDGKITYSDVYYLAKAISQTTGIPVSNVLREAQTIWDNTIGRVFPSLKWKK